VSSTSNRSSPRWVKVTRSKQPDLTETKLEGPEGCLGEVVRAGWTITHDPYRLVSGRRQMWVDLGAEQLLGVELGTRRIAVEVKSFLGESDIVDLEQAVGQFVVYRALLRTQEPERELWLAVPDDTWKTLFLEPVGEAVRAEALDRVLRVDPRPGGGGAMGDHDEWRSLIERTLTAHTVVPVSHGDIKLYTVFDRAGDHYLVMAVGWDGTQRVHAPLLHVDIVDGKIWVQHDGTEARRRAGLRGGGSRARRSCSRSSTRRGASTPTTRRPEDLGRGPARRFRSRREARVVTGAW